MSTATVSERKLLFDAPELAAITNLSERTIRSLIANGDLRSIKVGRRRLVTRQAVEDFIAAREADSGSDAA